MQIAIIGAGIGGLTAAASLIRRGHRVRVYEQAPALGEVGAAVQMSANAVKVLYGLGLKPTLESQGVKPESFEFRRFDDGELLHRIALGHAHHLAHGAPYYQIHRVDLHAGLLAQVRALDREAVQLGKRAVQVSETQDEARVQFEDGQQVAAELLVGADGIKSLVRQHVVDAAPPVFTGQVAWRLSIPTERIPAQLRPPLASTIWCGPRNHAVMYYMRAGQLLNFVGCVERPWEQESWTARKPWEELDHDYAGWHPMVRAAIENVDRDQCFRWALNNREPVMQWSTARVTLLGDAVHPTLPYMAQGAAMAIEDAAVLARALEGRPLREALQVYQAHRAPRAARVVRESNEMADLYHIADPDEMRRAFKDRNIAASRNGWLYPYDPLTVALT
ncbi:FAD-dependent monooxygenase [Ottowia sp. SB7-C50]|uniref:FAD-dependent monooxygenase n=1 Tax=Ottowia sp. SB7-C50 TaxID=3081231 RepID=UPI002954DBA9|nr:FAD-dependent monooxygenase [Ottowia sp. SB7-C50]WOP15029.1 FAD-dependent monooxygenase [Ottowia sp. SB7-C50]